MSKTIINTVSRIYWFDEDYVLHEITQVADPYYNIRVLEPVNEGQFRNLYITTNNYRFPKRWDGIALEVSNLGGLAQIGVLRAGTMEINNAHVIFGNIAKFGSGSTDGLGVIDEVGAIIDSVTTIIDLFGTTEATGYKRFNKTVIWSDQNQPEVYTPTLVNQAGDLDYDEDGFAIVRIKKLSEFNIIYKEKSIWLLIHVGLPFVYVKKFFTESVGLLANNAIVEIGNVHYFVGHDFDIWRFDGVNIANLSHDQGIKDYIISRVQHDTLYQTHAYVDLDRKEIQFSFYGKEEIGNKYRQFDIVYNYETNKFFKRDSVAKCGGYFEQTKDVSTIDEITANIDDTQEVINKFSIFGTPQRKLLIGDREGQIHLYNNGDSANGAELPGYFETGDEDYAIVSRNKFTDHTKLISQLQLMVENVGIDKDFEFMIGVRDHYDKPIRWKGPFKYKQNASDGAHITFRANGVYHRFKFISPHKNQFIRILGYTAGVQDYGEVIR